MGEFLILVSGIIIQSCFMLFRALCPRHTQPVETERRDATLAMMSLARGLAALFCNFSPVGGGNDQIYETLARSLAR